MGVDAPLVTVEVNTGSGLPRTTLVGMAETTVREARDRVKVALENSGFTYPDGHVTVSLAPAELRKEGGRYDLPIALAILAASGQVSERLLGKYEFIGELSLGGSLCELRGVLPSAIQSMKSGRGLVFPADNGPEAVLSGNPALLCAENLRDVVDFLNGSMTLESPERPACTVHENIGDLAEVSGQHRARRALEIAAAGNHHLLFTGPPGTGKTMLATRLPGLLPELDREQALETAAIASVSREGLDVDKWLQPGFRAPHHSSSSAAMVGGGSYPGPGEISLAHNGVLFLDELPEFNRDVLEVLREPIESGYVVISRVAATIRFPARFQLVAAMNPCRCGFHGDPAKPCTCSAEQVSRYRGKVSGPLLDRIDLFVEVSRPSTLIIPGSIKPGESSSEVRQRVVAAREIQLGRQGLTNAQLNTADLRRHCPLAKKEEVFLKDTAGQLALSPRGCQRVLKVARTLADLDTANSIRQSHLAEAIGFRQLH